MTTGVVSKINFFGDMVGSPVFILIASKKEVSTIIKNIIIDENITSSVFIGTIGDGVDDLMDQVEFSIFYPDVVLVDDWTRIEDYEKLNSIEYITVITISMNDKNIENFDKFDYILDNTGSIGLLKANLTGIVEDIFKH